MSAKNKLYIRKRGQILFTVTDDDFLSSHPHLDHLDIYFLTLIVQTTNVEKAVFGQILDKIIGTK